MSDELDLCEEFGEFFVSLMVTLAPILARSMQANLISPTEQAEVATLQASILQLFMRAGGTEEELQAGTAAMYDRMFGGAA